MPMRIKFRGHEAVQDVCALWTNTPEEQLFAACICARERPSKGRGVARRHVRTEFQRTIPRPFEVTKGDSL